MTPLRPEERRITIPFKQPFADAVESCRRAVLSRPDYDPARLFVWGQLMATGMLEMLKAVEARFGAEGQMVCRDALVRTGYHVAQMGLDGVEVPADLTDMEKASLFATWVNEQCYASLEEPAVEPDGFSFDITWCPHQDVYNGFDCRIQRYVVSGMGMAAAQVLGLRPINLVVEGTIPAGAPVCHFRAWRPQPDEGAAWAEYTRHLEERALEGRQPGADT